MENPIRAKHWQVLEGSVSNDPKEGALAEALFLLVGFWFLHKFY